MASSPLVRGLLAGAQLGQMYNANQRQRKMDAREDEKYAREEASRTSYEALQRDYYQNTGAFAPQDTATPETQAQQTASYDAVESQRLGVQMPAASAAVAANGLSLTPQQTASLKPAAMDPDKKDQLYYSKLGEWAATHLPPEKRMSYMKDIEQLREMNYNRQRTDAFRLATSGKKEGLELIAKMYNGMVPDKYDMDTTAAQFDPNQGWVGVKLRHKETGATEDLLLDDKRLSAMFMRSDPAQLMALRLSLGQEERENKKLGLLVNADQRADLAQTATEEFRRKELELQGRKIDAEAADRKESRGLQWTANALAERRLKLEEQRAAGDERAKDILTRMTIFDRQFGAGTKPGELSTPKEKEDFAKAQQRSMMATSIYQASTDGEKPERRNGIQAETSRFVNSFLDETLKPGEFLKQEDGTYSYGRLRGIPADIAEQVIASGKKPGEKPAEKPATEKPARMGLQPPASQPAQKMDPVARAAAIREQLAIDDRIKEGGIGGLGGRAIREGALPMGVGQRKSLEEELARLTAAN